MKWRKIQKKGPIRLKLDLKDVYKNQIVDSSHKGEYLLRKMEKEEFNIEVLIHINKKTQDIWNTKERSWSRKREKWKDNPLNGMEIVAQETLQ